MQTEAVNATASIGDMIDSAGGTTAFAKAMKVPVSTVHNWRVKNSVPGYRLDAFNKAIKRATGTPNSRAV